MITTILRSLTLVALSAGSINALAADVSQADVAGVRLGMSKGEAVAAAMQGMYVDKGRVVFDAFPGVNQVTKTKEPAFFTVKSGTSELSVYFQARIPVNVADPLVVYMVKYTMPWTPQNESAMRSAAVEKYGRQTAGDGASGMDWCERPRPYDCTSGEVPAVRLAGVTLTLSDLRYQRAATEYVQRALSSKPGF